MSQVINGVMRILNITFTLQGFSFSVWNILVFIMLASIIMFLLGGIFK